ncbi:LacI family DNA-binding transcriptional regulator [Sphingopyxis sp. R3-92]|uniref:LacI family DNA-binding transcriptional regulator n=1 Tax=Sphingopyxis sp. R3-92 TaxID=3158553 RepID=UPI003EE4BC75
MQTIKDVAARAGVSDRTVSRVVNGEPNISKKTRVRVEEAIAELNYIPNLAARMVRTNRSGVLGVITDVVSTTPNSVDLIRGIQDRISTSGQSILIANTSGTLEEENKVWRTFREHRIDGVLYATMYHRGIAFDPEAHAIPTVLVNCFAEGRDDVPAVLPDDYGGEEGATSYLIASGHSRIGYITLNPAIIAARLRRQAFEDVMRNHDFAVNPKWVTSGYEGPEGGETICAYEVVREILSAPPGERPTALLSGDDEIAMQSIFAAMSLGLAVPEDIAIVGFDDFQMISTRTVPQLTTVALPYYEIGMRAADKLLAMLGGEADNEVVERLPCPLIRRASA